MRACKKYLILMVLMGLLPALTCFASIINVFDIMDLKEHVHNETLVLFDLDNTVFEPAARFG